MHPVPSHGGLVRVHGKETKTMKYRNAFHYVAGGIAAWAAFYIPMLCLSLCLSFLAYEIMNDWRKQDNSYHDVLEFVIGIYVVATGLMIWGIIR